MQYRIHFTLFERESNITTQIRSCKHKQLYRYPPNRSKNETEKETIIKIVFQFFIIHNPLNLQYKFN